MKFNFEALLRVIMEQAFAPSCTKDQGAESRKMIILMPRVLMQGT